MSKAFMPLYIGDFHNDTRGLTTFQKGAYLMLIFHYWETGSLPPDERVLARIAGIEPRLWRKWRPALADFFLIGEDGVWRHKRIERELLKLQKSRHNRAQKLNEINERRSVYHNHIESKSTMSEIVGTQKLDGLRLPPVLLQGGRR